MRARFDTLTASFTRLSLCAALVLACACTEPAGQGGGGEDASTSPSSDPALGVTVLAAVMEPEVVVDTDADGLPDDIDPDPQTEPALAATSGASALAIERVLSRFDEGDIEGVASEGVEIVVEGRGFDAATGARWLVFKTGAGDRALEPRRLGPDLWSARAPADARSLHVVIGERRSHRVALEPLPEDRPRVLDPEGVVRAGESLVLVGARLDEVHSAWLGPDRIDVQWQTGSRIAVAVPAAPQWRTLRVENDAGVSNAVELDLRRPVRLALGEGLALPAGATLRAHFDAASHAVSETQQPVFDVRADRPAVFLLDLVRADGTIHYGALGALAWPDEPVAFVSADSTLLASLIQYRSRTPAGRDAAWRALRVWLDVAAASPAAADFLDAFDLWLATDAPFDRSGLRSALLETGFEGADLAAVAAHAAMAAEAGSEGPETGAGFLDDWIELFTQGAGPVITSQGGYMDDVVAFIANPYTKGKPQGGQNTTVPDDDLTAGESYSQFEVAKQGERRFVALDGSLAETVCRYPGGTQPPAGVTPSDLCVQNGTIVHASFAVYMPQESTFGSGYRFKRGDLVRTHIDQIGDAGAIKNGGLYLTADRKLPAGTPLCRTRTCYVEVLTGGLGLGIDVELTTADQEIVAKLRQRSLYENMLELAVAQIADMANPDQVPGCMANLVYNDPDFYDEMLKFGAELQVKKSQLTPTLLLELFSQTVGSFLEKLLLGKDGKESAVGCLAVLKPESELAASIEAKFKQAGATSGLTLFNEILKGTMLAGGVFLTPEKFVFKVAARAEITDVRVSGGNSTGPVLIDTVDGVYTDDQNSVPAKLTIDGTWLANEPIDDLDKRWTPTLRITDSRGAHRDFPLDSSHVEPISDISIRRLVVPITELFIELDELRAGPATLSLRYGQSSFDVDSRFAGYPGETLSIPSPIPLRLRTQPAITNVLPAAGRPGSQLTVIGSGLSIFSDGPPPLVTFINQADDTDEQQLPAASILSVVDEEMLVEVPEGLAVGAAYVIEIQGENGRGYVVSTVPFLTTHGTLPTITFGDLGKKKDDSMRIILQDQLGGEQFEARLPIDDQYAQSVVIDNATRSANGLPPIFNFEIECLNPGNDTDCTYSVIAENATVDDLSTGGNEGYVTHGGKLGQNERASYGIDEF